MNDPNHNEKLDLLDKIIKAKQEGERELVDELKKVLLSYYKE